MLKIWGRNTSSNVQKVMWAIGELGLPQTAPKQALADAVEWFRQNGYVNRPRPR